MSASNNKAGRQKPHTNGVSGRHDKRGKRKYVRTTPIGRALKNLLKATRVLEIVGIRLGSWGAVSASETPANASLDSKDLNMAFSFVRNVVDLISDVKGCLVSLEKSGFVPAKRSSVVVFKADDEVRVGDKYREKYLAVYSPEVLDGLVVAKVLPSGEIAVRHGKVTFIAPKSHLGRREGRA